MSSTLAAAFETFLADAIHLDHLRSHTLRAYRYELAGAAVDWRCPSRFSTLDCLPPRHCRQVRQARNAEPAPGALVRATRDR